MIAADIARALGAEYRSGAWWRCRCPAHGSAGASLALRDGDRGLIVVCHAGCSRTDIFAELRRRGLLVGEARASAPPDAVTEQRRVEAEATYRRRRIGLAHDMLASALPAIGTLAERYLRSRGYTGPIPPSIRFIGMHTAYGWHEPSGDRRPVMVAAVQHVENGFVGVSRTFLAIDGSAKASFDQPRLFTGPVAGGAVHLGALQADLPLVIAEGVESALAASELSGWPAWAALSAGGIGRLVLPAAARDIVIACDRDPSGVGERYARIAASRWSTEGRRIRLVIPDRIGADPNDLLREVRRAA